MGAFHDCLQGLIYSYLLCIYVIQPDSIRESVSIFLWLYSIRAEPLPYVCERSENHIYLTTFIIRLSFDKPALTYCYQAY